MARVSTSEITQSVNKLRFISNGSANQFPLSFNVTLSPTSSIVAAKIDRLGVDIRSFRVPLHDAVRDVMTQSIRQNFESGGRPAWEPLSDATLSIREKMWGNTNSDPLIWTGKLRRIASQINMWTITGGNATIRSLPPEIWYGKIHQAGYGGKGDAGAAATGGLSAFLKHSKVVNGTVVPGKSANKGTGRSGQSVHAIPARPFLTIQPEDQIKIEAIFIQWLDMRVANSRW